MASGKRDPGPNANAATVASLTAESRPREIRGLLVAGVERRQLMVRDTGAHMAHAGVGDEGELGHATVDRNSPAVLVAGARNGARPQRPAPHTPHLAIPEAR